MDMANGSSPTLVGLSILVAIFATFTALNLSGRIAATEGAVRRGWILAAAVALGGGTWAMHFVGMLALNMPADYDIDLTLVSLALPILVSMIGIQVVARDPRSRAALAGSGLLLGLGIGAMHYTGMAAMRMPGVRVRYDALLVTASLAVGVAAATAALWLAFRTRGSVQRLAAAVVMGGAISGVHYVGMAAIDLVDHGVAAAVRPTIPSELLAVCVAGAATLLLVLALVTAFFDRKLSMLTTREAEALQRSEERYRLLIENASDVIGILNRHGCFVFESANAGNVLGYLPEETVGRHLTDFIAPDSLADAQRLLAKVTEQPSESAHVEVQLVHRSGERRTFDVVATNLLHAPAVAGIVLNLRDVTERKRLVAQLETLSETDLLTEVLNRRGFDKLAERAFERARKRRETLTVVMMDIDHFKRVNDRYGHAAGDLVLAKVAQACGHEIRSNDILARLGGEEFVILLADTGVAAAQDIANRMKARIAACTVSTIRGDVSVTASFGIALVDPARTELADALHRADEALYEAKNAGRDCVKIRA